jgi:hypothetical protein
MFDEMLMRNAVEKEAKKYPTCPNEEHCPPWPGCDRKTEDLRARLRHSTVREEWMTVRRKVKGFDIEIYNSRQSNDTFYETNAVDVIYMKRRRIRAEILDSPSQY